MQNAALYEATFTESKTTPVDEPAQERSASHASAGLNVLCFLFNVVTLNFAFQSATPVTPLTPQTPTPLTATDAASLTCLRECVKVMVTASQGQGHFTCFVFHEFRFWCLV